MSTAILKMKVIHVVIRGDYFLLSNFIYLLVSTKETYCSTDPSKAIANDLGLKALKVVLKVSRMTKKKFPKTLTVKKKTQIKKMQRNQTKNKIFLKLTQNIHVMGLAVLQTTRKVRIFVAKFIVYLLT